MITVMKVMKGTLLKLALMLSVVFVISCEEYLPEDEFIAREYSPSGTIGGHGYVDLGLPSGTKWATCNVGATKLEEYGGYYAWGETEEKEEYSWSTYKWCNGTSTSMTKYCTNSSYGTVDNKTVLDPEDDVAHVKWGGTWRMPTHAEQDELCVKCKWKWTTLNGVIGYKVTGPNGNSIFLPAAGYCYGAEVNSRGSGGYYWSGSLSSDYSYYAYYLYFFSDNRYWYNSFRYYGLSVRPVCNEVLYNISVGIAGYGSVEIKGYSVTNTKLNYGTSVTVVAKPNEDYVFNGWYVNDVLVSTVAEYTFTVSADVALVAKFKEEYLPSGSVNGHAYVDLGLPSGLKWATCNVGASAPEEYGGYYAWGETEENFLADSWNTYKWCNGTSTSMTKYCTDSSYGTVDNKTVLDPEDDVAHVKWGGTWRMPTKAELEELLNNCNWTWTTQNGVNGYIVTGPNGNSIFLPHAGLGRINMFKDIRGYYWSSSLDSNGCNSAYYMCFEIVDQGLYSLDRYNGQSVRPVSD